MVASGLVGYSADPIWRAQRESVYEPSERDQTKLVLSYNTSMTYNSEGKTTEEMIVSVDGTRTRTLTTYDTSGRVSGITDEEFAGGEWVKTKSKEIAYDDLTGVIVSNLEYTYSGGQEYPGNCYRRTITRNDAGNITEVELAVLFHGKYDPTQRMQIEYDATSGRATSIVSTFLTYSGGLYTWMEGGKYTDLEWHNTDGQIASVDDLFRGNNRLTSGHYYNTNNGTPYFDYDITASYDAEGPGFTALCTGVYQGIADTGVSRTYSESTGDDGITEISLHTCYYSLSDPELDPENYRDVAKIDAYGIELENSSVFWSTDEADAKVESLLTSDVTYDETYGYPLTVAVSENDTPLLRVEYSDYIDCSTISGLHCLRAPGASGGGEEWFDLGGRKVAEPGSGLYIMRGADGRTVKRFVR